LFCFREQLRRPEIVERQRRESAGEFGAVGAARLFVLDARLSVERTRCGKTVERRPVKETAAGGRVPADNVRPTSAVSRFLFRRNGNRFSRA